MKITFLLAVLAGLFTTGAYAQSSVTLYGVLDTSVGYTAGPAKNGSPGGSAVRYGSGLMQTDVIGVKGAADLGGGLRVVYKVEGEFSTGTASQPGRNAGRVAYVGVGG
jgi:GBP family porin